MIDKVENLNLLKISFVIGGIYDISLGFGLLLLRNLLSSILKLTNINIPIIADALGLFLIGYGVLLINEPQSTDPHISIGLTSAVIRICYFFLVFYYFFFSKIEVFYIFLAFTDLATGLFIILGLIQFKSMVKNI